MNGALGCAVSQEMDRIGSIDVTLNTANEPYAGTSVDVWGFAGQWSKQERKKVGPLERGESKVANIPNPTQFTMRTLTEFGAEVSFYESPLLETHEWKCHSVEIVVNGRFRYGHLVDRWLKPQMREIDYRRATLFVSGNDWQLHLDTGTLEGQSVPIPDPGPTIRIITKIIGDFSSWLTGHGPFPAQTYIELFAKNVSQQEWAVIHDEYVARVVDPSVKGGWMRGGLFLAEVISCYADAFYACKGILEASERNAIRHAVWQIGLTQRFSESFAKKLGDAHEIGRPGTKHDEEIDRYNNEISRSLALQNPREDPYNLALHAWVSNELKAYSDEWNPENL